MTTVTEFAIKNITCKTKRTRFILKVAKELKGAGLFESIHESQLLPILKSLN